MKLLFPKKKISTRASFIVCMSKIMFSFDCLLAGSFFTRKFRVATQLLVLGKHELYKSSYSDMLKTKVLAKSPYSL